MNNSAIYLVFFMYKLKVYLRRLTCNSYVCMMPSTPKYQLLPVPAQAGTAQGLCSKGEGEACSSAVVLLILILKEEPCRNRRELTFLQ